MKGEKVLLGEGYFDWDEMDMALYLKGEPLGSVVMATYVDLSKSEFHGKKVKIWVEKV